MHIEDLDQACLLRVMQQLDPLSRRQLSASCRRFRDLMHSDHLSLVVCHDIGEGEGADVGPTVARRFASVAAAVAASKAGDTVLIRPSPTPYTTEGVVVSHALHIVGGGADAGAVVLLGASPAPAVLEFRASGRMANLTVSSYACACVLHARGTLAVLDCRLHCDTRGLGALGLLAPLVTTYLQAPARRTLHLLHQQRQAAAQQAQQEHQAQQQQQQQQQPRGTAVAGASAAPPPVAAGRLSVQGTRISGDRGTMAVRQFGCGALRSVRVIPGLHATFWLEADSSSSAAGAGAPSATPPAATRAAAAGGRVAGSKRLAAGAPTAGEAATAAAMPAWMARLEDPEALAARLTAASGAAGARGSAAVAVAARVAEAVAVEVQSPAPLLAKKACLWHATRPGTGP